MSAAGDLVVARLVAEEAAEKYAYNDATGARVTCQPEGNLTIGVGINLETGLDDAEIAWLLGHRVELVEQQLQQYTWYTGCNAARQSVLLDIAFNAGIAGLLGFKNMINDIELQDWAAAQKECMPADPELDSRYEALGQILLTGTAP